MDTESLGVLERRQISDDNLRCDYGQWWGDETAQCEDSRGPSTATRISPNPNTSASTAVGKVYVNLDDNNTLTTPDSVLDVSDVTDPTFDATPSEVYDPLPSAIQSPTGIGSASSVIQSPGDPSGSNTTITAITSGVSCRAAAIILGIGLWLFFRRRDRRRRLAIENASRQYLEPDSPGGRNMESSSTVASPSQSGYVHDQSGFLAGRNSAGMGGIHGMVAGLGASPQRPGVLGGVFMAELADTGSGRR